jgi:hypothetical protein
VRGAIVKACPQSLAQLGSIEHFGKAKFDNLLAAAHQAQRGKHDRCSVAHFLFYLEPELLALQRELRAGTYRLQPYHTFTIYEPKQRQICAAAFRDRADDKPRLHDILASMRSFLHHTLRLTLKDEAVRIAPVMQGIPFLGFSVLPGLVKLQRHKWARFRRRVRQREAQYRCGIIDEETLAQSVASMLGHLQHANTLAARRVCFATSHAQG